MRGEHRFGGFALESLSLLFVFEEHDCGSVEERGEQRNEQDNYQQKLRP